MGLFFKNFCDPLGRRSSPGGDASGHVRNAPLATVGPKKAACRSGPLNPGSSRLSWRPRLLARGVTASNALTVAARPSSGSCVRPSTSRGSGAIGASPRRRRPMDLRSRFKQAKRVMAATELEADAPARSTGKRTMPPAGPCAVGARRGAGHSRRSGSVLLSAPG